MKHILPLLLITVLFIPSIGLAHSGGTDSTGGHYCWTNCGEEDLHTGEYHYHNSDDSSRATFDNNDDVYDRALAQSLHGQILLQVDEHGEAFYIRSKVSMRYNMKDGDAAYEMMRFFSLGITDIDLASIPSVVDTTEMNESSAICAENDLADRLRGEILLQVEQHGEAWYVDPDTCRTIYMEDGAAAYEIMRFLGLGITNEDLEKIPLGSFTETKADTLTFTSTAYNYSFEYPSDAEAGSDSYGFSGAEAPAVLVLSRDQEHIFWVRAFDPDLYESFGETAAAQYRVPLNEYVATVEIDRDASATDYEISGEPAFSMYYETTLLNVFYEEEILLYDAYFVKYNDIIYELTTPAGHLEGKEIVDSFRFTP